MPPHKRRQPKRRLDESEECVRVKVEEVDLGVEIVIIEEDEDEPRIQVPEKRQRIEVGEVSWSDADSTPQGIHTTDSNTDQVLVDFKMKSNKGSLRETEQAGRNEDISPPTSTSTFTPRNKYRRGYPTHPPQTPDQQQYYSKILDVDDCVEVYSTLAPLSLSTKTSTAIVPPDATTNTNSKNNEIPPITAINDQHIYCCPMCGEMSNSISLFFAHFGTTHDFRKVQLSPEKVVKALWNNALNSKDKRVRFPCPFCTYRYKTKSPLRAHIIKKHIVHEQKFHRSKFFCNFCNVHLDIRCNGRMRSHLKYVHQNVPMTFPCGQDGCDTMCQSETLVRFHRLNHSNVWEELDNNKRDRLEIEVCYSKRVVIKCPVDSCNYLAPFTDLEDFENHVYSSVHSGGDAGQEGHVEGFGGEEILEMNFEQEEAECFVNDDDECEEGIFPDL